MITKDTPMHKALYFDLDMENLRQFCSETSPNVAYYYIYKFLRKHDFEHAQGSGYHSNFMTTNYFVVQLIDEIARVYPWFSKCIKKLEVADVGNDSNLMRIIHKTKVNIDKISRRGCEKNDENGNPTG